MAKFYGEVGYGESQENPPGSGVWTDQVTEVSYYGDVIRNVRKLGEGEMPNDLNNDITLGNSISIVADEYANRHFILIKYVRWMGELWTVSNVEVRSPRLILSLGSVYNGPST